MRDRCLSALTAASLAALTIWLEPALAARFTDLSGNWAERAVNILSDRGVVPAEADGKFKPDDYVTRAVLCAWLVKVTGVDKQPVLDQSPYKDVKKSDWFYKPVLQAVANRYIAPFADGFRPHQNIQRGEVIVILARAAGKPVPDRAQIDMLLSKYSDAGKVPAWAREGIALATQLGIVENNPDPLTLNPTSVCTRADCASLCYELQEYLYKQSIDKSVAAAEATARPQAPPAAQAGSQAPDGDDADDNASPGPAAPDGGDRAPAAAGSQAGAGQDGLAGSQPGPPPDFAGQVQKNAAPGAYLQGNVTVVDAGTHFRASLLNTLNSAINKPGEEFVASLTEPVFSGGVEVLPVGSKIFGQITNVVSAKSFHFSANGKIDVKFTGVEMPDGRRYPLVGSVDARQLKQVAGTNRSQAGAVARKTGKGAMKGLKYGAIAGAVGGATTGNWNRALKYTGVGALAGSVVGAGTGLVAGGVQKGAEANVPAGTTIPIQLDEPLQVPGSLAPVQTLQGGPQGTYNPAANFYGQ